MTLNDSKMNFEDLDQSLHRHDSCQNAGLCIRCVRPLKQTSLKCHKCSYFRYCNSECLERDIPRHHPLCDILHKCNLAMAFLKEDENDGELVRLSPVEIIAAYLKEQKQELCVSVNSNDMNNLNNHDSKNSASTDSRITDSSQCSSARVSDNQGSSARVSETEVSDSFGKGWWVKNKDSTKKFKQENKSKHVPLNDTILVEKNAANQNTGIHTGSSRSECSNTARNQSAESQTFSRYNADSHDAIKNREDINSASKPIADIQNRGRPNMGASKSGNSDPPHSNNNGKPISSKSSKTTDSFGSGWWQVKKPSKLGAPSSSPSQQALLNPDDSENKQGRQNKAKNTNSSNKAPSTKTSENSGRTAENGETRKQTDTSEFGSGWWKHRFANSNTRKTNTTEPNKPYIPTKRNIQEEAKDSSSKKIPEFVNKCTDVVPYTILFSLENLIRFSKVMSKIGSKLVEEEAMHGRFLSVALFHVPGLAKASLGGSRVSMLMEIVGLYPCAMLGILARDKFGHTAPVLIHIDSIMYTVPGTDYKIPYSDCIMPGNFIILRAVYWEQLPSGKLAIVMRDIKNVNFIFYKHLT